MGSDDVDVNRGFKLPCFMAVRAFKFNDFVFHSVISFVIILADSMTKTAPETRSGQIDLNDQIFIATSYARQMTLLRFPTFWQSPTRYTFLDGCASGEEI